MIKKFNEFEKIEEGIVGNFKKFFSKEKEKEKPVRSSSRPMPEPSGDETSGRLDYVPGVINGYHQYAPKTTPKFPCVYSFLTKEKEDRMKKSGEPIGIRNNGYAELCETPEELEEIKIKYKVGNTYNGETISDFDIGPERHY